MKLQAKSQKRSQLGAAIAEFGGAFALLVVFFFMPLVNMSFIGVRFFIAQGVMQELVHRMALCNKRSDSYSTLASDSSWSDTCNKLGVQPQSYSLSLLVVDKNGSQTRYQSAAQQVPSTLLPGGANAPCIYTYVLSANVVVPPIYGGGGPAIPGLTSPIPFTLQSRSAWENLSQDPSSTRFFINE